MPHRSTRIGTLFPLVYYLNEIMYVESVDASKIQRKIEALFRLSDEVVSCVGHFMQ